ncbi:MAG: hypothetical protein HY726_07970 [Candidatus Rokubacteria bacterium]|nr:hypothetical protein [Candidatus Rokubacteria bacterium]
MRSGRSVGGVAGVVVLGGLVFVASWGCSRAPERQWQKMGDRPYTMAEFQRDRAECTRGKQLDFDCMRSRGWVDVSPDRPKQAPSEAERERRY